MNTMVLDIESENDDDEMDFANKFHSPDKNCNCSKCQLNKRPQAYDSPLDLLLNETGIDDAESEVLEGDEEDSELEIRRRRRGRRLRTRPNRGRSTSSRTKSTNFSLPRRQSRHKHKPRPKPKPPYPVIHKYPRPHRRHRPLVICEPAEPCICPAHGTEFVRWVQSSLNQILGLRLVVNGIMNRATRNAVREFQKKEGFPVDGIAGPEVEHALINKKINTDHSNVHELISLEASKTLFSEEKEFKRTVGKSLPGQYGIALRRWMTNKNKLSNLVNLLTRSSIFMKIVNTINKKYVAYTTLENYGGHQFAQPDEKGILTKGKFRRRRILIISFLGYGTRFYPAYSFHTTGCPPCHSIHVPTFSLPLSTITANLIHETVHAFLHLKKPVENLVSRETKIRNSIINESQTRKKEKEIITEILMSKKNLPEKIQLNLKNRINTVETNFSVIERDFISGEKITYLEHFVLSVLMDEQRNLEKLDSNKIKAIERSVSKLYIGKPLDNFLKAAFPENLTSHPGSNTIPKSMGAYWDLLLVRRVIVLRWQEFFSKHSEDDPGFGLAKEQILQAHAKAFFQKNRKK